MWCRYFFLFIALTVATLSHAATEPYCPPKPATEAEQKEIFKSFYQLLWVTKNVATAFNKHVSTDYIQHNPYATSGRQRAIDALTPIWPSVRFTLANLGFSDNIGYVHQKMEMSGQAYTAVIDVLRMNGTCIMEHWDVNQQRPKDATNPLAMF